MKDGIYARLETNKGHILIELTYKQTPGTVANFVGLAEGLLPNDVKKQGEGFYDGLTFHRVIKDFMIQGGCPLGTGTGGPGYKFDDEFHQDLKHAAAGVVSMANSGENTNGSQFFITHCKTPWLDNKHTVFGFVLEGQGVVDDIEQGDVIEHVQIIRQGKDAENWDPVEVFANFNKASKQRREAKKEKQAEILKHLTEDFEETPSGLFYKIERQGNGRFPTSGSKVSIHYRGSLLDGTVFDSSYHRKYPLSFTMGQGQLVKGFEEAVTLLSCDGKGIFVLPPDLAYGSSGAGGVIPPDAFLIFEMELVSIDS